MFLHARRTLSLAASLLWTSAAPSAITQAQQAIRVETKQVLVPVIVIDKKREDDLLKNPDPLYDAVLPGQQNAIVSALLIHGLTAADFQLFDDGKQQTVQSVTEVQSLLWNVRDNRGYHTEYIGPGGGKWSSRHWPPGIIGDAYAPQYYVLAYTPPTSPVGSCHQIEVMVKRRNASVRVRPEYCNNPHSASDPLYGTSPGKQMEAFQTPEEKKTVEVSLIAMSLHRKSGVASVQIVVEWPWQQFKQGNKSRTNAVLGMVLDKQGNTVARFSDLAEREGDVAPSKQDRRGLGVAHTGKPGEAEERYERQLDLPPGNYKLRVVLGDGNRFGRAEIPLVVESYDGRELAISEPSLSKQIDDFSNYGHESVLAGAWSAKLPDSYIPLISNGMQFKPTPNTRFKKGENLYTYFEVYEPLLASVDSQVTVEIQLRVVDAPTGTTLTAPEAISAAKYIKPADSVIPIGRGIDISKLPSGSYRLEIRATDSIGKSTAWRTTDFSIE